LREVLVLWLARAARLVLQLLVELLGKVLELFKRLLIQREMSLQMRELLKLEERAGMVALQQELLLVLVQLEVLAVRAARGQLPTQGVLLVTTRTRFKILMRAELFLQPLQRE
jgi:hypothetical protein